jgi:hypothetical protein
MTGADWLTLSAGGAVVFTALLFARALVHKLTDFTSFTGFVADYGLLPEGLVRPASMAVVAAEAAVVLGLLVPGASPAASLLAAAVLLGYAGAIASAVRSGRRWVECGCGGAAQPVGWPLVARNGVLAAIALVGAAGEPAALDLAEAAAVLVSGFALFVGYLLVEQILGNAAHAATRAR